VITGEAENDPAARVREGSCVKVLEGPVDGPKKDSDIHWGNSSVARFEGEEDIRAETMDLPVVCSSPAPIESQTAENSDLNDFEHKIM